MTPADSSTTERDTAAAPAPAPRDVRVNFAMLVGDVSSFLIGTAFLDSSTTLPAIVDRLGGRPVVLGTMLALRQAAYYLPPLFVAHRLQGRTRYKPFLLKICIAGRAWMFPAAFLLWRFGQREPALALGGLMLAYTLSWAADGSGGVPWTSIIGRAIPLNRRGALFATSQVVSAVGRLVVGGVALALLAGNWISFPVNAALLTLGCALLLLLSWLFLCGLREPPPAAAESEDAASPAPVVDIGPYLRSLPGRLRARPELGRLALAQILANAAPAAAPFIVAYAERETNAAPLLAHLPPVVRHLFVLLQAGGLPGLFLIVQTLGVVLLAPLWGYLTDRWGAHHALYGVFGLALLSPLFALTAHLSPGAGGTLLLFLCAYFCFGAVQDSWVVFTNLLLELVPPAEQPTYIAIMSAASAPALLLPLGAGLLADHLGAPAAFVAAIALLMAGMASVTRIPPPPSRLDISAPGASPADAG